MGSDVLSALLIVVGAFLLAALLLLAICHFSRKKLAGVAYVDPLTGGLSERAFLARASLKGRAANFSFVSVQAENLDEVCVSFGVDEQPLILKRLHAALDAQLNSEELFVRTGEDTFGFLLKNRKPDEICARLERICNTVNQNAKSTLDGYQIELRFGIYLPESTETDPGAVMGKAVQARLSGPMGRRYNFYDRALWETTLSERDMAFSMDQAIQTNEFVVYYQPKVRVLDQRIGGAEALK